MYRTEFKIECLGDLDTFLWRCACEGIKVEYIGITEQEFEALQGTKIMNHHPFYVDGNPTERNYITEHRGVCIVGLGPDAYD